MTKPQACASYGCANTLLHYRECRRFTDLSTRIRNFPRPPLLRLAQRSLRLPIPLIFRDTGHLSSGDPSIRGEGESPSAGPWSTLSPSRRRRQILSAGTSHDQRCLARGRFSMVKASPSTRRLPSSRSAFRPRFASPNGWSLSGRGCAGCLPSCPIRRSR